MATGRQTHSAAWQMARFFVPHPGLPPPRVAIRVDFHQNSTTSLPEMPCLSAFRASRSAKTRSRLPRQPPPPYAWEAIASLCTAEYVRTSYQWQLPACVAHALVSKPMSCRPSAVVAMIQKRKGYRGAGILSGVVLRDKSLTMLSPKALQSRLRFFRPHVGCVPIGR